VVFIQVIKLWSTLPEDVMDMKNILVFKETLDNVWKCTALEDIKQGKILG